MKVIQSRVDSCGRRKDETVKISVVSELEISSQELGEIDSYRGCIAMLVLTDTVAGNDVLVNVDDIIKNLPKNDIYDNYKSPSKRLRGVLYRVLEQKISRKPTEEEFADFYVKEMNRIFQHYADKLDSDI